MCRRLSRAQPATVADRLLPGTDRPLRCPALVASSPRGKTGSLHNPDADYDRTLMAWLGNVDAHWHEIADHYSERTRRMFRYYLSVCAGAFRARNLQLWQIVYSRGRTGRYDAPR
ncbi:class I SAM-dependent methyltransferase [Litchfieldella rifensis]|uniref:Class I SAM-dependent methyltransferase n=1 Tax=Litchfieldella rifensis TaxID=762643 RepID=A0ABV7LUY2_9GAMM